MGKLEKFLGVANLIVNISNSSDIQTLSRDGETSKKVKAFQNSIKELVFQLKDFSTEIIEDNNIDSLSKLFIIRFILEKIERTGITTKLFNDFTDKEYFSSFLKDLQKQEKLYIENLSELEKKQYYEEYQEKDIIEKMDNISRILGEGVNTKEVRELINSQEKVKSSRIGIEVNSLLLINGGVDVYIDNEHKGKLASFSVFEIDLSEGRHEVFLMIRDKYKSDIISQEFEPYRIHLFEFGIKDKFFYVIPTLKYKSKRDL